jgi:hypothetical protein
MTPPIPPHSIYRIIRVTVIRPNRRWANLGGDAGYPNDHGSCRTLATCTAGTGPAFGPRQSKALLSLARSIGLQDIKV